MVGLLNRFKVELELPSGLLPNGQKYKFKGGLETCHHNFNLSQREWLTPFGRFTTCTRKRPLDGGTD